MVPGGLKDLLVPGSLVFLLVALVPGVLLLLRRKDGGRAGKIWITALVALYWVLGTPMAAAVFVDLLTPDVPPVMTKADARGATAIVVLGSGMDIHRSRGGSYGAPTRDGSLRVLEAARVHRVLGGVPIIATGGHGSRQYTEAGLMAHQLEQLGAAAAAHHDAHRGDLAVRDFPEYVMISVHREYLCMAMPRISSISWL